MSKIKTVGIVGTGVIGTGWIIRNLAHNKIVHAYDQNKIVGTAGSSGAQRR